MAYTLNVVEMMASIVGPEYVKSGSTIRLTCFINQANLQGFYGSLYVSTLFGVWYIGIIMERCWTMREKCGSAPKKNCMEHPPI
ncbi:hypothetical protein SK128_019496 [Halocaridina rubra]|uniref:Uncharacterized protein n=1 Tax=Halocaridina rubra TaxID=373956 RepID=A0AAN8X2I0_HALRR